MSPRSLSRSSIISSFSLVFVIFQKTNFCIYQFWFSLCIANQDEMLWKLNHDWFWLGREGYPHESTLTAERPCYHTTFQKHFPKFFDSIVSNSNISCCRNGSISSRDMLRTDTRERLVGRLDSVGGISAEDVIPNIEGGLMGHSFPRRKNVAWASIFCTQTAMAFSFLHWQRSFQESYTFWKYLSNHSLELL